MSDDEIFTVSDDAPPQEPGAPAVDFTGPPAPTEATLNPFGLTPRELTFAYACVELDDREEAAARIDPVKPAELAARLWNKPRVRRMYDLIVRERQGLQTVQASDLINTLASIAEANVVDAFKINSRGKIIPRQIHEMPPALLIAIKKIRIGKAGVEIELHDKLRAVELIGQYQGLWGGAGARRGQEPPKPQAAPRTRAASFEERLAEHQPAIARSLAGPTIDVTPDAEKEPA